MNDPVFEIPSDPKYLREASLRVMDSLKPLNLSDEVLFDIRLCLEEAIVNAIKYGSNFDRTLPVTVAYSFDKGRFEVIVRDRGRGFDYTKVPDPRQNKNILKHGGRGLFLIRSLMDEVEFNDNGNEIKMVKFLSGGMPHGGKK